MPPMRSEPAPESATAEQEPTPQGVQTVPTPPVAKVKMNLKEKTDAELASYVGNHLELSEENPNFSDLQPTDEEMAEALALYKTTLKDWLAIRSLARKSTLAKKQARKTLEKLMVARGASVQCASGGNPAKIKSIGLGVVSRPTPVGVLPPPGNLQATLGRVLGVMKLSWNGVPGARGYLVEWSLDVQPRQFVLLRSCSRTSLRLENLSAGTTYVFRFATLGGSKGQSVWSPELIRGAA